MNNNMHYYTFGIFSGCVILAIIYTFINKLGIIDWVYAHETLSGSFIAAFAAACTVYIINKQIQQTQSIENTRRKNKLDAERAVLPHALSELTDYAKNSLELSKRMAKGENFHPQRTNLPHVAIATLKKCIEFAPSPEKEKMAFILNELQVDQSRKQRECKNYRGNSGYLNTIINSKKKPGQHLSSYFSSSYKCINILLIVDELWYFARATNKDEIDKVREPRNQRVHWYFRPAESEWQHFITRLETIVGEIGPI
ncbi:hypothetical protein [Kordiimonas sp. SCSIO 12610]|uniref:hypothetical protein n=1 Tax=Kordiimonas sp. SCSIO 12610 TaxID=2829597 RepID=UPI00210AD743|nr:hypothetical protein [Kordiimonas sp. SCSIO 12610]UTW55341.1 hypothetical protein KFF44_00155 [Kordiimonas sp. SCSIO 12610]